MASNNHRFTVTDERLDWEHDDPWAAFTAPEEEGDGKGSVDGGSAVGSGEEIVEPPARRRMVLIAAQGALGGGLVVALVAVLVFSGSSRSSAPRRHLAHAHPKPSAKPVVVGAAAPRRADGDTAHRPQAHHPKPHTADAGRISTPPAAHHSKHRRVAAPKHQHKKPHKHQHHHQTPPARRARHHKGGK